MVNSSCQLLDYNLSYEQLTSAVNGHRKAGDGRMHPRTQALIPNPHSTNEVRPHDVQLQLTSCADALSSSRNDSSLTRERLLK